MGILEKLKKKNRKNKYIKVNVKLYPNLLEKDKVISSLLIVEVNTSLFNLLKEFCSINKLDIDNYKSFSAIVSNRKYSFNEFKRTKIKQKDIEVLFVPQVGMPVLIPLAGMVVGALVAQAVVGTVTAVMVGMMIGSMVGSLLEYALFPPKLPEFGIGSKKSSPTYSWDRIQNTLSPEQPVPLIYGMHKVGGEFINVFLDNRIEYEPALKKQDYLSEWGWKNSTVHSSTNKNTFRVTGDGVRLRPALLPLTWTDSSQEYHYYDFGYGIFQSPPYKELEYSQFKGGNFIYNEDLFLMNYKIRYKKTTDTNWTEINWSIHTTHRSVLPSNGNLGVFQSYRKRLTILPPPLVPALIYKEWAGHEKEIPFYISFGESGTYDFEIIPIYNDIVEDWWYLTRIDVAKGKTESIGEVDNYLNMLLALGEGEIQEIEDIKVNDQPIDFFTSELSWIYQRLGTNNQTPIEGFSDIHSLNESVAQNINGNEDGSPQEILIETSQAIERFALNFLIPALYDASSGSIKSFKIHYKVAYKITGQDEWLYETNILEIYKTATSSFQIQYLSPKLPSLDFYTIKITRLTKNYESDTLRFANLQLLNLDEIIDDKLSYPNTALLGVRFLASDRLSGSLPNITSIVKGIKILVPELALDDNPEDVIPYDMAWFDGENYQTPMGQAHYTGEWVREWSNNPVWVLYDILTNKRYGLGQYLEEGEEFLLQDREDLKKLAEYCDELVETETNGVKEKRFMLDCVIDSDAQALDLVHSLCSTFRCFDFISNGKVNLQIDKPGVPVQMFNTSNIIAGSFTENFASISETPNVIEISFMNRDKDYEKDTIVYEDRDDLLINPIRKKTFNLYGITRPSQALRMAKYLLLSAKLSKRVFSFSTSVDGFICQPGDIILFQHDVDALSYGGRVVSASDDKLSVFLDTEINVVYPSDYEISIRFNDFSVETRNIVSINGFGIVVDNAFTLKPDVNNIWIISKKITHTRKLRVISIERDLNTATITAVEYNELIYDDTGLTLPEIVYEPIYTNILPIRSVVLGQRKEFLPDGTIQPIITVGFTKPLNCFVYDHANIYISDDDGASWKFIGSTKSEYFEITSYAKLGRTEGGIWIPATYNIGIASVDKMNREMAFSYWAFGEITILPPPSPEDVSGFEVSQEIDNLFFRWNEVSNDDRYLYEIRRGKDWNNSVKVDLITAGEGGIRTYLLKVFPYGLQTYFIKAINRSGLYSVNPDVATINVLDIPGYNNFLTTIDYTLDGDKSDNLERTIYYDSVISITDMIIPETTNKWDGEELNWDSSLYFDFPQDQTEGYYYSDEIDVGDVVTSDVKYEIYNTDFGSIDIRMEYRYKELLEEEYSDWTELTPDKITFRYIQFRVVLKVNDELSYTFLFGLEFSIVFPDLMEQHQLDITPASGLTLNFEKTYHIIPCITITTIDNPYIPVISDLTKTSCLIKLYNGDDLTTGKVVAIVKGY